MGEVEEGSVVPMVEQHKGYGVVRKIENKENIKIIHVVGGAE